MTVLPPATAILQVLPRLEAGGVERGTVEIAQAVVADGGPLLLRVPGGGWWAPSSVRGGGT